jgi:hypothetical protein
MAIFQGSLLYTFPVTVSRRSVGTDSQSLTLRTMCVILCTIEACTRYTEHPAAAMLYKCTVVWCVVVKSVP